MDSLTQIVLGAATGELILGRKLGNKALLLGAIGGTLPDLDIIYNFFTDDPLKHLAVHRGYSHSMFTHLVVALPLAWISKKWNKLNISFSHWYIFWMLCLVTHALLDCCTTYGTRFFLPFTNYQVAFNNISIIDPLYTIPFLLILSCCLFVKPTNPLRRKFLYTSIAVSGVYMLFTFFLKFNVHNIFRDSLSKQGIAYNELNSTPTILNSVLWNGIAYNDSVIYTAEYSFLKQDEPVEWIGFDRNPDNLKVFDSEAVRLVTWFSDGNYFTQLDGDTLSFYNIKWGRTVFNTTEPAKAFLFYWKFHKENGQVRSVQVQDNNWNMKEAFAMLMDRIGI